MNFYTTKTATNPATGSNKPSCYQTFRQSTKLRQFWSDKATPVLAILVADENFQKIHRAANAFCEPMNREQRKKNVEWIS
jgi:hypothetical protein